MVRNMHIISKNNGWYRQFVQIKEDGNKHNIDKLFDKYTSTLTSISKLKHEGKL